MPDNRGVRSLILLAALAIPAFADPFYQFSVDGVGYSWNYDPASNYAGTIQVFFSAPISFYEFDVRFPYGTVDPQIWVNLPSSAANVTWDAPQAYSGPEAVVNGPMPNFRQLNISLGTGLASNTGLFPIKFAFTELVDPPDNGTSQLQEAPEPGTVWLALIGLGVSFFGGRWGVSGRPFFALARGRFGNAAYPPVKA